MAAKTAGEDAEAVGLFGFGGDGFCFDHRMNQFGPVFWVCARGTRVGKLTG